MRADCAAHAGQAGVSLVELMVAMLIGLLLVSGMVAVQQQVGRIHRTVATVGRLQETARLALDVIEADVRMANHWGLHSQAAYVVNRATPGAPVPPGFTAAQGDRIDLKGMDQAGRCSIELFSGRKTFRGCHVPFQSL